MTTFDELVTDVAQTLYGYGITQPRAGFLTQDALDTDTNFNLGDASNFEQGIAEVGNEIVFIDSVDDASNVLSISPDGRGYAGTLAEDHFEGERVTMAPTWTRRRIAIAVNETIVGTYPNLYGVFTYQFTYNPSITTYEIPSNCDRIIKVTADTIGPSREQLAINRYSFNSAAISSNFESGNSLTLEKGAFPGRNITVVYRAAPSEIDFGDEFTDCGLAETAKLCVKYGACANLLSFMDSSRIPVASAVADEYDPSRSGVGSAAKTSTQLFQHYLLELENERKRLREIAPVPITVRTR